MSSGLVLIIVVACLAWLYVLAVHVLTRPRD